MPDVLVLDTDVLIDIQRGYLPALSWIQGLTSSPHITGFTAMELVQDARNKREVATARSLVAPFDILWPTQSDCEVAHKEFERLHRSHNLGLIDALIAATVVGSSGELVTRNSKHYRAFPGLTLVRPYR